MCACQAGDCQKARVNVLYCGLHSSDGLGHYEFIQCQGHSTVKSANRSEAAPAAEVYLLPLMTDVLQLNAIPYSMTLSMINIFAQHSIHRHE